MSDPAAAPAGELSRATFLPGCACLSARKAGLVMSTSPSASRRITRTLLARAQSWFVFMIGLAKCNEEPARDYQRHNEDRERPRAGIPSPDLCRAIRFDTRRAGRFLC